MSSKKTRIKKDPQGLPFEEAVAVLKVYSVCISRLPRERFAIFDRLIWLFLIKHFFVLFSITKSIEVGRHDNTFELHIRTRRDKSQLPVRGSVSLPKNFAKEVAVLVFTTGDKAEEAKAAGAHTVGGVEFIEEVRCV